MNKLIVREEECFLSTGKYLFTNTMQLTKINVHGDVEIKEVNPNTEEEILFLVDENSHLRIDVDTFIKDEKKKWTIYLKKGAIFDLKMASAVYDTCTISILVNLEEDQSEAHMRVRLVGNNKETSTFSIHGHIMKDTNDTILEEDIKCLELVSGSILIEPNMYVDSFSCVANHKVTISNFSLDELFYLKSRGLEEESAKSLLESAFLK